jgi:hypothetical protein
MIDKIMKVNDSKLLVIYDNRSPLSITADNGFVLNLLESILSPRWDMTYSSYLNAVCMSNEDTSVINLEDVA